MNSYARLGLFFMILSGFFFFACKTEKEKPKEEKLSTGIDYKPLILGNWMLEKAYRDGEVVDALVNTAFQFRDDGTVSSNFNMNGEDQNNIYTLKDDVITQKGKSSFTYLIKSATDSTLILHTRYRGYDFQLELKHWEPDADAVVQ